MPTKALATAPVRSPPATICFGLLVLSPAKTPPASLLGAPASGMPPGSMIESKPIPLAPPGALANHRRPKALLIEMPSGLLTDGCEKWLHNFRRCDEWHLCLTAGTVVPANQERR